MSQAINKRSIRAIISGSLANLLVWYDWYIYSAFAIYFSASFFPHGSQTVQLLQTAGVFALGFFMRPVEVAKANRVETGN